MDINEITFNFRHLAVSLFALALTMPASGASKPVLANWEAFDAVVQSRYAAVGSEAPLYPPSRLSFMLCEAPRPFDPDGFAGLTNTVSPHMLQGNIPAWGLRVVETQLTCRAWVVYAGNRTVHTNAVPTSFDTTQWVNDAFGDHPAWLSGDAITIWYQERERNRIVAQYTLIPSDRFEDYQAAMAAAYTNVSPSVSGPVIPADTNRVAFASIAVPGSQDIALDLYAPTSVPIDLFWRGSLAASGLWTYAGTLQATHPFTPATLPRYTPSLFLHASRADIDTDSDGLPDGLEMLALGTNPDLWDTDGDGIQDRSEIYYYGTDPNRIDTDGDGLGDLQEVHSGLNPNKPTHLVAASSLDFRVTIPIRE